MTVVLFSFLSLVTIALTAYIVLKSVQLGLQWQLEAKRDNLPTMPNVVVEKLEERKQVKQTEEQMNILNEWFNGGEPK